MRDKIIGWLALAAILGAFIFVVMETRPRSVQAQGDTLPRADCYASGIATSTGEQIATGFDNRGLPGPGGMVNAPCTIWHLMYYGSSNLSSTVTELSAAPDANGIAGTFNTVPTASGSLQMTATNFSQQTSYGFFPWVNVDVGTLSPAGSAVYWQLLGWKPGPNTDVRIGPQTSTYTGVVSLAGLYTTSPTNGTLVAAPGGTSLVQILGLQLTADPTNPTTFQVSETTGACSGATTPLTGKITVPSGTTLPITFGAGPLVSLTPAYNVCVNVTGTFSTGGYLSYQYSLQ